MGLVIPNLPSYLPSLASGLVPGGHHYYEGSDSSAQRISGLHAAEGSLLISIELPSIPSPTTLLPFRLPRFSTLPLFTVQAAITNRQRICQQTLRVFLGSLHEVRGSRFTSTLPDRLGRIEFTFVTDCSFSSSCSPPFLLKSQLPSDTGR